MSPEDQKKRFLAFADRLESGAEITQKERTYLQRIFFEMGSGRDANEALGLKYLAGQSVKDVSARQNRSVVIKLMETMILPRDQGGLGFTRTQAILKIVEYGENKLAYLPNQKNAALYQNSVEKRKFPKYSYLTLEKMWKAKKNSHMRKIVSTATDIDSPYQYNPLKPKK